MSNATLSKVISEFSLLSLDEKEYVLDNIEKQVIEAKRNAIAKRAKRAMTNLKRGLVRRGTVNELHKDLEID